MKDITHQEAVKMFNSSNGTIVVELEKSNIVEIKKPQQENLSKHTFDDEICYENICTRSTQTELHDIIDNFLTKDLIDQYVDINLFDSNLLNSENNTIANDLTHKMTSEFYSMNHKIARLLNNQYYYNELSRLLPFPVLAAPTSSSSDESYYSDHIYETIPEDDPVYLNPADSKLFPQMQTYNFTNILPQDPAALKSKQSNLFATVDRSQSVKLLGTSARPSIILKPPGIHKITENIPKSSLQNVSVSNTPRRVKFCTPNDDDDSSPGSSLTKKSQHASSSTNQIQTMITRREYLEHTITLQQYMLLHSLKEDTSGKLKNITKVFKPPDLNKYKFISRSRSTTDLSINKQPKPAELVEAKVPAVQRSTSINNAATKKSSTLEMMKNQEELKQHKAALKKNLSKMKKHRDSTILTVTTI
ncbi:unnamed protein product [Diamesa tonsa]